MQRSFSVCYPVEVRVDEAVRSVLAAGRSGQSKKPGPTAFLLVEPGFLSGAREGIRTPNLLIRSQMLYPLSYARI